MQQLNKKGRKLKVSASYRRRKYKKSGFVPQLKCSGQWLIQAGFNAGDNLEIEVSENQLIIRKAA